MPIQRGTQQPGMTPGSDWTDPKSGTAYSVSKIPNRFLGSDPSVLDSLSPDDRYLASQSFNPTSGKVEWMVGGLSLGAPGGGKKPGGSTGSPGGIVGPGGIGQSKAGSGSPPTSSAKPRQSTQDFLGSFKEGGGQAHWAAGATAGDVERRSVPGKKPGTWTIQTGPQRGAAGGGAGVSGVTGGTPIAAGGGSGAAGGAGGDAAAGALGGLGAAMGPSGGGQVPFTPAPPPGYRYGLGMRAYPQENPILAGLRTIY